MESSRVTKPGSDGRDPDKCGIGCFPEVGIDWWGSLTQELGHEGVSISTNLPSASGMQMRQRFAHLSAILVLIVLTLFTVPVVIGIPHNVKASSSGWTMQKSGVPDTLNSVKFVDNQNGWAAGADCTIDCVSHIIHTFDGGLHWSIQLASDNSGFEISHDFLAMDFVDAQHGWAVGGSFNFCDGQGYCPSIATTVNGSSWSPQNSKSNFGLTSVSFVDIHDGWAVGGADLILYTTDGGSNWVCQHGSCPISAASGPTLYGVKFVNTTEGWAVGEGGTILRTTDGGASWSGQQSGTSQDLRAVDFVSPTQGWVVGDGGTVLHTTDGVTWSSETSGTSFVLYSVAFYDSSEGLAVGQNGVVVRTLNGGSNWVSLDSGVCKSLRGVSIPSQGLAWAVGDSGTILHFNATSSSSFADSCTTPYVEPANPDVLYMIQGPEQADVSFIIPQAVYDTGLTFKAVEWKSTGNNVPDLTPYKAVILLDTGGHCCQLSDDMPALQNYVSAGGGLVILGGAIFQMGTLCTPNCWVGVDNWGYTGGGAQVSVDNPLGSSLRSGDVLQAGSTGGAQYVYGLQPGAEELAGWNGDKSGAYVYSYSFPSGQGHVFYQASIGPQSAGYEGYNRLLSLLSGGILYAVYGPSHPPPPLSTASAPLFGGKANIDQTPVTGTSVSISNSSAPDGTTVTVTSQVLGSIPPPGTTSISLDSSEYFDVLLQGISDGIARVCIDYGSPTTVMQYWDGDWRLAGNQSFTAPSTTCGDIPVSSLTGTRLGMTSTQTGHFAGYTANVTSGTLTKVSGKWNVPPVTCQPSLNHQQGLLVVMSLYSTTTSLSVGLVVACPLGSSTPTYTVVAYFYPADVGIVRLPLTVNPGDMLSASITVNPSTNKVVGKIADTTTGFSATRPEKVSGASTTNGALWKVEPWPPGPATYLAEFTFHVKFSSCSVVHSGVKMAISQLDFLTKGVMVDSNNKIIAKTSVLSSTAMSFKVTFVRSA